MQNLKRVWRKINSEELEKIKDKLEGFGVKLEEFPSDYYFLIFEMRRKEVVLVKKRQIEIILKLRPYTAGISFGEFKGKEFNISLAGGAFISNFAKKRRVFLDSEGSLEFIYGRDVGSSYVVKADPQISDGDLVLVLDERSKYLGLGRAEIRNFRVSKVKNVIDIGWYLRSEIDENKAV